MKKLYTLLLAAAVTLTAAAASPFQAKKAAVKADFKEVVSNEKLVKHFDLEKMGVSREDFWTPASRATMPSFDRFYMQVGATDTIGSEFTTAPCHIYEDPSEAAGSGFYLMDDFFIEGSTAINADLVTEPVQISETETMDVTFLRIAGAGQTIILSEGSTKYGLWLAGFGVDPEDGKTYLYRYSEDIDFALMKDGSLILWYGDNVTGIAMRPTNGSGMYNLSFNPQMLVCNGEMQTLAVSEIDSDGNITKAQEVDCKVYAEYSAEEGALILANFANYGNLNLFEVNVANSEATATRQGVVTLYLNQQGTLSAPGYLSSVPNDVTPVTFTMEAVDGKTSLKNQQSVVVIEANEAIGVDKTSWWRILVNSEIILDFEIPGLTGISNVTVADENAPVEYYNLQGVRVANPESGLYIKRQGNKATKVLVK